MIYIISLRGEICAHNTSLTPSSVIEVSVPSQESESVMYLFVRSWVGVWKRAPESGTRCSVGISPRCL
jgi:hypothetical protein